MLTVSAIKADVGSIGGHTRPSEGMLKASEAVMKSALGKKIFFDYKITFTGDDICLLMSHSRGEGDAKIHNTAWEAFVAATKIAQKEGLYGAGQDLLKDAPSGNVRGAGPGVAEISFDPSKKERPVEAIMVFTADKCGPGAYNFPLWTVFTSPLFDSGLMLPNMTLGFKFRVIDMEYVGGDRIIELNSPEEHIELATLLRDENRFGVQAVWSRKFPEQKVVSVSTDRLHTIAGEYKGKDDPVCIIRTQGIFPAPEEVVGPYEVAHYVAGDARGSHHMPLMPAPINTAVSGTYCLPLVSCMAYSINRQGKISEGVDVFGNIAWDDTRILAQKKAKEIRRQGVFGPAMLPISELEYGAMRDSLAELEKRFKNARK
ncbi:fructose 1,6-bisphosphatase [Candidatus Woesebacteria bacterium]|nr:fructose 1,6-bisphosphatase [Candidatus Woesebacteria bacterium]